MTAAESRIPAAQPHLLTVARDRIRREGGILRASEVVIAIEIISPGSRRTGPAHARPRRAPVGLPCPPWGRAGTNRSTRASPRTRRSPSTTPRRCRSPGPTPREAALLGSLPALPMLLLNRTSRDADGVPLRSPRPPGPLGV